MSADRIDPEAHGGVRNLSRVSRQLLANRSKVPWGNRVPPSPLTRPDGLLDDGPGDAQPGSGLCSGCCW
jgi:hypothetical protein